MKSAWANPGALPEAKRAATAVPNAATPDLACFHCGLPVPANTKWRVAIADAERAMCCPGCAAVAQAIVGAGQEAWYANRDGFAATVEDGGELPPELALYSNDDPRFIPDDAGSRATDSAQGAECEALLLVDGIRCAACVWLIERRLRQLPGVLRADVNAATGRLRVRWRKVACQAADLLRALHAIGYRAWPYDAERHSRQLQQAARALGRRLFVAGLSMMQVMMYVAPAYLADDGTLDAGMAALMQWASLLLTLPAVCYAASPFFAGAWSSLRACWPNREGKGGGTGGANFALGMDVPVALGIAAAFLASVAATWRGEGAVYYDSVTMFIFLLLASRYLELTARRKAAGALERLRHGTPAAASLLAGWPGERSPTTVAATGLRPGDCIAVKPGEAFAADGDIVEGHTAVDLSLLTGESAPQTRHAGDSVPGGAINAGNAVVLRVTRAAADSTLAGLLRLVERAGMDKPAIAQWADRTAGWFVACLLLFALGAFAWWQWHDPVRAWPVAIAVLVVSCPCALSLATPSALAAATDRLLVQGVLVVRPHVLETLHRATHIVFDKTGTLTEGKPTVRRIARLHANHTVSAGPGASAALQVAAGLAAHSAHPAARAIVAAATDNSALARWSTDNVLEIPGMGLEGVVFGQRYRLGSAAFAGAIAGSDCPPEDATSTVPGHRVCLGSKTCRGAIAGQSCPGQDANSADCATAGMTPVYLASQGQWIACFYLSDALRGDAQATLDHFRALGKQIVLLSGDRQALVTQIAHQLGMPEAAQAIGDCLPEHKLDFVRQLQRQGAVVAMVGDGINDAAVLGSADVSFAMGGGAALAQVHADAVLLNGRLDAVAHTADMAARTMRVIRQNLAWAMLYNATAIPAAACGLLSPWLSGVGMALSSAVVVANALRLRRA